MVSDVRTPPRPGRVLLSLLLVADAGFIALHILSIQLTRWARRELVIHVDGSIPEHFQFVKLGWAAILALMLARYFRGWSFVAWAVLLAYVVVDDFFMIHEWAGRELAVRTGGARVLGLPAEAVGELVPPALAVLVTAPFILWGVWRSTGEERRVSRRLFGLVALLAAFGVVLDFVHTALGEAPGSTWKIWELVEDGGELVIASLILALVFAAVVSPRRDSPAGAPGSTQPRSTAPGGDASPGSADGDPGGTGSTVGRDGRVEQT